MDLRCDHRLHGKLNNGLFEVKCNQRGCGAGPGKVVIHKFDLTGNLIRTDRYREPRKDQIK